MSEGSARGGREIPRAGDALDRRAVRGVVVTEVSDVRALPQMRQLGADVGGYDAEHLDGVDERLLVAQAREHREKTLGRELELELIQSNMAQKPVLRGEVGCACVAREVSVERGGMGERGCARRLGG